jgi:hypothetical protein
MSSQQGAYYNILNKAINDDPKMTSINIVDGDKNVQIASVKTQTVDVGDIQKMGTNMAMTAAGVLGHETTEQRVLQSNFSGVYSNANIASAHRAGINAENQVNGSTRVPDMTNNVVNGTGTYIMNYQQNGQTVMYGVDMVDNNVSNVVEIP